MNPQQTGHRPTLKAHNRLTLWSFVSSNIVVFAAVVGLTDASIDSMQDILQQLQSTNTLLGAFLPIISSTLNCLLPSHWKATMVFWRFRNPLPGCRAFSHLAKTDPRIDLESLKVKHGSLPRSPGKQNQLWYRIFQDHQDSPKVREAHRLFLLFRDLASLCILLLLSLGVAGFAFGTSRTTAGLYASGLTATYILTAIAARNCGRGFVRHVLAEDSST